MREETKSWWVVRQIVRELLEKQLGSAGTRLSSRARETFEGLVGTIQDEKMAGRFSWERSLTLPSAA